MAQRTTVSSSQKFARHNFGLEFQKQPWEKKLQMNIVQQRRDTSLENILHATHIK